MMYYIYHIPGKKIGMTCDLYNRVTEQQGYESHEYEVLAESKDIDLASVMEIGLQKEYGYKVDRVPYNKLKCNRMKMKINVTEQTTTFPCPVNKLKGQLMDNVGMEWETEFGDCMITDKSIKWIMKNVKESMYNTERCYIYNKAFSRWFDNNNAYELDNAHQSHDRLGGNLEDAHMKSEYPRTGALSPTGIQQKSDCCKEECTCMDPTHFDLIRDWADERGLYDNGDSKTQALKLVEEVGETCRAILKEDHDEVIDGIGDCVVVLTNLAELVGMPIEDCIQMAYNEIKNRKGKMQNGTFKKDDN
jgi:NTP pyrophosphatase (non-canonical NTP hydrolase)